MYKVLIVDDEPIVSVTIKSLVKWEEYNIDMAYEAHNGKQALNLLEENPDIDIVMTDINMPVMDGLKLIEEMKSKGMTQIIFVLSAYEDYSLVRTAFKYGITDYILKTEIDAEKLLDLFKNVPKDQEKKEYDTDNTLQRDNQDYRLTKEMLLKEMLYVKHTDYAEYNFHNLRIKENNLVVCFLWIDDFLDVEERYANATLTPFIDSILNTIKQILDKQDYGEVISMSPDEYAIILSLPLISKEEVRQKVDCVLKDIKNNLIHFSNTHVTIGVSDIGDGFEVLPDLYKQAEKNASFRFIFGKQKIIYPENVTLIDVKDNLSIIPRADGFTEALKAADETRVMEELECLLEHIASQRTSIDKMLMYYTEIIFVLIKCINDLGEDVVTVFGKDVNFYQQITKFETGQEINIWIKNLISWVVEFIKNKKEAKMSFAMSRAITFIQDNFKDENISVWMVSNYMGLSESHFSALFKKEMGETFTNYITGLRIEEAKKLMRTTNMKIYEICDYIGYNNVEHFSRLFKKVTGNSPNHYKNQN